VDERNAWHNKGKSKTPHVKPTCGAPWVRFPFIVWTTRNYLITVSLRHRPPAKTEEKSGSTLAKTKPARVGHAKLAQRVRGVPPADAIWDWCSVGGRDVWCPDTRGKGDFALTGHSSDCYWTVTTGCGRPARMKGSFESTWSFYSFRCLSFPDAVRYTTGDANKGARAVYEARPDH